MQETHVDNQNNDENTVKERLEWASPEIKVLSFKQTEGNQFNSTQESTFGLMS